MKIVVVGGGSVGLSSALVCHKAGHVVSVYDPFGFELEAQTDEIDARVWALGYRSTALLSTLNAWTPDERVCPYQSMHVIDARSDARVTFTDSLLGHLVEARWVRNQLLKAIKETTIELAAEPVKLVSETGLVQLDDQEIDADLVIFAEGKKAQTAIASGFEVIDGGYRQCAVVGTLQSERPHHGQAFQIFTTAGPLALLPLPDQNNEHRVSLVWSLDLETASELKSLSAEQLAQELVATSENVRGQLRFVGDPLWIPLSQHCLKQDALGSLLAIGDTAHGILPLAGLGANLGFGDVAALKETLKRHPNARGDRIARAVARERRFEQRTVATVMGLFSDGFRSDQPLVQLGRSFALRTADQHPMLRSMIQELAG